METVVNDVIQTSTMPFKNWLALSQPPFVPLAIPVKARGRYHATQRGIDAAHKLSQQTWQAREDLRQTLTRDEFNRVSFTAVGETIRNSRAHLPKDGKNPEKTLVDDAIFSALADDYRANLDRLADQAQLDVYRHIPCHLFHGDQGVPAFLVGPVEFRPRADWINRFVMVPLEHEHIMKVEARALTLDDFRQQALAPESALDIRNAWEVLSFLGRFEWVATIKMAGHAFDQSHRKASVVVGLAIDAIGLRFQVEDARHFVRAGRNHLFAEHRLATSETGAFIRGSSVQIPGLRSAPGALAAKIAAERPFLDAAGHVLKVYVQHRKTGRAPHLVERWANALYWIGEARREAADFMAVVNYGCAADGLSGAGGEAKVMVEFSGAALNPKGEPALAASIEDAVTTVYREGRNKLAHGEMPGLFEDLAETRAIGDTLLAKLFDVVTSEIAELITSGSRILKLKEKHAYRGFLDRLRQRSP